MHNEVYSDGIGEITVSGSVVRIDLVSLSPTERDAANNPKPVFRQRIVMPIEAFANAADLVQKVLQGLVDAGAVTRTSAAQSQPQAAGAQSGERPKRDQARPGNVSPNFN